MGRVLAAVVWGFRLRNDAVRAHNPGMSRAVAAVLAALVALAVATTTAVPASAAVSGSAAAVAAARRFVPTGASYFGVHEGGVTRGRWPQVPPGTVSSVRLWDTGTTWRDVNPARGVFRWDALDAAVANARAHGADVDLVLGSTPQWAARYPWSWVTSAGSSGMDGSASPPVSEVDWVVYVQAVATRYRGRIAAYEVWNEANLSLFWQGSTVDMARLSSLAYRTIKRIDPHAVVAAPSATLRGSGTTWLSHYANVGGFRYADAINVHAYPRPEDGPEGAAALIRRAREVLAAKGVRLPVWNTEINYGHAVGGVGSTRELSVRDQAAFVARTYLLGRSDRVARTYWYDWSYHPALSVRMTRPGSDQSAPPATAFVVTRAWLRGRMAPCLVNRAGTRTCTVVYAKGRAVVTWNPRRVVTVTTPANTVHQQNVFGQTWPVGAGRRVRVGSSPMLFRTYR